MSSLHVGRGHVTEEGPPRDGGVLDYSVKRTKTVEQSSSSLGPPPKYPSAVSTESVTGGWIQMNYTVVPYVVRLRANKKGNPQAWLPLSVLRNAANLLTNVEIGTMRATTDESAFLNRSCAKVGLAFKFAKHTKLVTLEALLALNRDGNITLREISAEELAQLARSNGGSVEEQKAHQQEKPQQRQQPPPQQQQQTARREQQQLQQRWGTPSQSSAFHRPAASGRARSSPVATASLPRVPSGGHPARPNGTERNRTAASTNKSGCHQQNERNKHQTRPLSAPPQADNHSRAHSVVIQPARVCGKTISCLVKDDGRCYALLEALRRVFFPLANVKALQSAIENEAKLPTKNLTSVEEKAFIAFYKLPLKVLRCRLLVDIELVAPHLNALQMVLQSSPHLPPLKQNKVPIPPGPFPERSINERVPAGSQNGPNKTLPPGEQTANIKCQKAKKRSLEDMINKLKHAGP